MKIDQYVSKSKFDRKSIKLLTLLNLGFDGGFNQTFKIRYQREGAISHQYVDVAPQGVTTFEVQDLKVATKYSISIMAFNSIGVSSYTDPILVTTNSKCFFALISKNIVVYFPIDNMHFFEGNLKCSNLMTFKIIFAMFEFRLSIFEFFFEMIPPSKVLINFF